jgi:ribosomal protein S3
VSVTVPNERAGLIVGKGGESIRNYQLQHGCRVSIDAPEGATRTVHVLGHDPAAVAKLAAIFQKITVPKPPRERFGVPTEFAAWLIVRGVHPATIHSCRYHHHHDGNIPKPL